MAKVYINSIITYLFLLKIQIEHGNTINMDLYIWGLGKAPGLAPDRKSVDCPF